VVPSLPVAAQSRAKTTQLKEFWLKTSVWQFRLRILRWRIVFAPTLLVLAIGSAAQQGSAPKFKVTKLSLPGASGLVMLDYIAYDRSSHRLWVPAGNTGKVDVVDDADQIQGIEGFTVAQVELRGKPRPVGPSSVAVGKGFVYVGSRADSNICTIDAQRLQRTGCIEFAPASSGMAAAPDGLIYIAVTQELWATSGAPPIGISSADHSIKIFSTAHKKTPTPAGKISLPGSAEGYAVDNEHGRFYTNLEETGQTIVIDVRQRKVVSKWNSCGGPSGVAVDSKRGFVFVACTDHVIVLDGAHEGRVVASVPAGAGVDNIDYAEDAETLYAAAADAAQLTIAKIDNRGQPTLLATVPTTKGTRSVVAGSDGNAYLIDPYGGSILKVSPASR
jgi:DNA-binding beta-propeller fold protein YncE